MFSSGDALRVLRGWKNQKTVLDGEFALAGENPFGCDIVQVVEVSEQELEVFAGKVRSFDLTKAELLTGENVPQRFRNAFTRMVVVLFEDG